MGNREGEEEEERENQGRWRLETEVSQGNVTSMTRMGHILHLPSSSPETLGDGRATGSRPSPLQATGLVSGGGGDRPRITSVLPGAGCHFLLWLIPSQRHRAEEAVFTCCWCLASFCWDESGDRSCSDIQEAAHTAPRGEMLIH